jgi:propionyl-CoA synthetase
MSDQHVQDRVYQRSLEDPEAFWRKQSEYVHWHKKPKRALERKTKTLKSGIKHDHWSWYPEGEISTTFNCVDRHVINGKSDQDVYAIHRFHDPLHTL